MQLFIKPLLTRLNYVLMIAMTMLILGGLLGCSASFNSYVADYQKASQISENASSSLSAVEIKKTREENFALFKAMFADLKNADITATIQQAYADDLYFNDTFRSLHSAQDLTEYLQETVHNLTVSRIEFDELATNDNSYFLSWTMYIEFEAAGEKVSAESIGVTQIRFNDEGKINFHQDFWDNTQGFFAHIPYLGYFINKVRARL